MTRRNKRPSNHYIDGKLFTAEVAHTQETGDFSDELIAMFYLLAEKTYEHRPGAPRHSYIIMEKEDAVQEAVMLCFKEFGGFDLVRGTAYVYFRSVIRTCYRILAENASRGKRNPGNDIFDIVANVDIETDNRISYLMMQSQNEDKTYPGLQPAEIREIKSRLADGEVGAVIARDFDVHPSTVSNIKTGKWWGDV